MLGFLLVACAFLQTPADPGRTAQELLSDPEVQTELPEDVGTFWEEDRREDSGEAAGGGEEERNGRGGWDRPREREAPAPVPRSAPPSDFGFHPALQAFGLILAAGLIAFLAAVLVKALMEGRSERKVRKRAAADRPKQALPAPSRRPLDRAEALARRGLFAEAIHAILLHSFAELQRGARLRLDPALTSREVLALLAIPDACRPVLRPIVEAVEVSRFGPHVPARADYERCAESYRRFLAVWKESAV